MDSPWNQTLITTGAERKSSQITQSTRKRRCTAGPEDEQHRLLLHLGYLPIKIFY